MTVKLKGDILTIQGIGSRDREIGRLENRVLYVTRDSKLHRLKKWDAYGFNHEIVTDGRFFDFIEILEDRKTRYIVAREDIAREGRVYQAPGQEKQIFITIPDLLKLSTVKSVC